MWPFKKRRRKPAPVRRLSPEEQLTRWFSTHQGGVVLTANVDRPHIGHLLAPDFRQYSIPVVTVRSPVVNSLAEAHAWLHQHRRPRLIGFYSVES